MSKNPFEGTSAAAIARAWEDFSGADFLKADNGGNWTLDGAPADKGPWMPLNYRFVFQRWQEGRVIDTKSADGLDLDELNAAIDKELWEDDEYKAGEKKPPWQRSKQLVLMNLASGRQVIVSASNIRMIISVTNLIDQIRSKGYVFGKNVVPLLELGSAPFNTAYGMQRRGDFKVAEKWVDIGGVPALPGGAALQNALAAPTMAQELNDEIPDFGASDEPPFDLEADATPPARAAAKKARR